jgi:hypothetical protein
VSWSPTPTSRRRGTQAAQAPRSDAAMLAQINATAKAMEEVAKLTPEQLAQRRVEAASAIADCRGSRRRRGRRRSTLLVTCAVAGDDAKDSQLLGEACRLLVQHEECASPRAAGIAVRQRPARALAALRVGFSLPVHAAHQRGEGDLLVGGSAPAPRSALRSPLAAAESGNISKAVFMITS